MKNRIGLTSTAAAAAVLLAVTPAFAASWTVDHDESRLGVVATQMGSTFNAEFHNFQAEIDFDPDNPEDAHILVEVDMTSFDSSSRDRDDNITHEDWFHAEDHPRATFDVTSVRKVGDDSYEADADLTIKGVTQTVTLPFTLEIEDDTARVEGDLEVIRTDFNVGEGEWEDPGTVGLEVRVEVDLLATRAD